MTTTTIFILVSFLFLASVQAQNESIHASPLQKMYISVAKPGLGAEVLSEPVFKANSLTGYFNSCAIVQAISPEDASDSFNASKCYDDDIYNDRITFQMSFSLGDTIKSAFASHPPSLQVIDQSNIANPEIIQTEVDPNLSRGVVTIAYHCTPESNSLIRLLLTLRFSETEQDEVKLQWTKKCKGGVNDAIEFGYLVTDQSQSKPKHHLFSDDTEESLTVHPSDVSTEIFAKLGQTGAQQAFLAPYVTSSNPDVAEISVRGNHPSGGVLTGLNLNSFQVNYECLTKGSSTIFVTLAIPPFNNLTATWEKECGGNVASNLMVGTTEGSSDVVESGKPTPKFLVGMDNIRTEHSEEHFHLPGNQSAWTIYLKHKADGDGSERDEHAALHVGRVTLTIEHPDVLVAPPLQLKQRGTFSWKRMINNGQIIRQGEVVQISLHFICRKIGESRILITIPVLQYDTLEFGIAKECTHVGKSRKSRQIVLTTNNIFWMFISVSIIVIIVACVRIRRKQKAGFAQVSTQEV